MTRWFLIPALLTACGGPADQITETGTCPELPADAPTLDYTQLTLDDQDAWLVDDLAAVLTNEDELAVFEEDQGFGFTEDVDFATEQILVAGINTGSTCGFGEPSTRVVEVEGTALLELEVLNPDGTCAEVCDMAGMALVAVKVGAEREGAVCARLIETCE